MIVGVGIDAVEIAALNPCPCGYWGDKKRSCQCSRQQISRYLDKLSGPLLDRIDLQINVQSIEYDAIKSAESKAESSRDLLVKVDKAIAMQKKRCGDSLIWNAYLPSDLIEKYCVLTSAAEEITRKAFNVLNLSMCGYHKMLKVARTIADLEESEIIDVKHIQEAIMYRSLDQTLDLNKS